MNPEGSAHSIFNNALELDDPAARARYIDEACAGDTDLSERVKKLLHAHDEAGGFFSQPSKRTAADPALPLTEKAGDTIGRYKLLEQIGEGGCGVVYMAEQQEPVRRRVALKVIKLGMDTKQVVARFEAERQALALMDHPNIAKVHDAGATASGRPFFVMELVRGRKITEFCDEKKLSTDERLILFISVCRAVQHAHQKGIIHRDLKPSNILVTTIDGLPVPKVIDFGIAKATSNQPLTDKTLFTAFEQFIGTPAYMSPEHAEMSGVDVDTRTDVYSLGVVLYELLTARTPFDAEALRREGIDEIRRTIREQQPPKPSTRLHALSQGDLTTTAQARHVDGQKLIQTVKGDLDWIVMKCLEKDRSRRYETANGLAMDVQRFLDNEPVVARPPSRWYEFQKTVRRHKFEFAAAGALMAVLTFGLVASRLEAARAKRAELKAETEAARSEQVARLMKGMLEGVGPSVAAGRDTAMLREILDNTAERVGKELANQPEVEAELRATLCDTYLQLSEFTEAETMAREALRLRKSILGEANILVAASLHDVARVVARRGQVADLAEAETLVRQALALRRARLGDEHPEVADSNALLAGVLQRRGKLAEAEAASREALAARRKLLGAEHKDVASSLDNLALVLIREGKRSEAETMLREALAIQRKVLGENSADASVSLKYLAEALEGQGKPGEAETALQEALAISRKLYGEDHPNTAGVLSRLSALLREHGKTGELETLLRQQLEESLRKTGSGGQANNWLKLAKLHGELGDRKAALDAYEQAVALSPTDGAAVTTARTLSDLGSAGLKNGEWEICERSYRLAARVYDKLIFAKPNEPNYRNYLGGCYHGMMEALCEMNRAEEGMACQRQAIAVLDRAMADLPEKRQAFLMSQGHHYRFLAFRLWGQGNYEQARTAFEKSSPCFLEFAEKADAPGKAGALQGHAMNLDAIARLWEQEGRTSEAHGAYLQSLAAHELMQTQGLAPLIITDWRIDHYNFLANLLEKVGTPEDASRIARVFCTPGGKLDAATLLSIASCRIQLGNLLRQGKQVEESNRQTEEARVTLTGAIKFLQSPDGKLPNGVDANGLHASLSTIATALLAQDKFAETEPLARECLKLRETLIPDDWRTFNARSLLGGALLGQKKHAEAEPLLISGYDGMKQREDKIPAAGKLRLNEARQRLVRLYEETNRPAQAASLKDEQPSR